MNRNTMLGAVAAIVIVAGGGVSYAAVHKHNNDLHATMMMQQEAKQKADATAKQKEVDAMKKAEAATAGDSMKKTGPTTPDSSDAMKH